MDKSIRIVGRVGDRDPMNDGGVILDHGDGGPQLVYMVGVDLDNEDRAFWLRYTCDLLDIDEALNGPGNRWADVGDVASSCGMTAEELIRLSKSSEVGERAVALIAVAGYYGWEEFDRYPERYTEAEAQAWADMLDERESAGLGGG